MLDRSTNLFDADAPAAILVRESGTCVLETPGAPPAPEQEEPAFVAVTDAAPVPPNPRKPAAGGRRGISERREERRKRAVTVVLALVVALLLATVIVGLFGGDHQHGKPHSEPAPRMTTATPHERGGPAVGQVAKGHRPRWRRADRARGRIVAAHEAPAPAVPVVPQTPFPPLAPARVASPGGAALSSGAEFSVEG
jgi:hypothetical protein